MDRLISSAWETLARAQQYLSIGHFGTARALAFDAADLFRRASRPLDSEAALALAREAR